MLEYGTKDAEIIDYGIFNEKDECQTTINNNDEYTIKLKVKFNRKIEEPIFAIALKDIKGLELGGVNTKAYKKETGTYQKGDITVVKFKQTFPLMPERYAFSFGCTKFNDKGELKVFDRKYDAFFVEIVANRDCLGIIDLKSKIELNKEQE